MSASRIQKWLTSPGVNKLTTFCSAIPEGSMGLIGTSFFVGYTVDMIANQFTTFTADLLGISRWGYLSSIPFAVLAGYGSYKCHYEVGKCNVPQPDEIEQIEDAILTDIVIDFDADAAKAKEKDELIVQIQLLVNEKNQLQRENTELKSELAKLKDQTISKDQRAVQEKNEANTMPLTWGQKTGITGEYVAHMTGFAGFVLQIVNNELGFGIEMTIVGLCILIGLLGAIPETGNARSCMRINNLRLFKQSEPVAASKIGIQQSKNTLLSSESYTLMKP